MTPLEFQSIPVGSLLQIPLEEREGWLQDFFAVPSILKSLLSSFHTGSYIRGLVKNYKLIEDNGPHIAFMILRVTVGDLPLAQLGTVLSSKLKLANDVSQKMAAELEHDLFAPVAIELNQYLENRKREIKKLENKATGNPRAAGATNILDLKNKPKPPVPPPIPRRRRNP